MPTYNLRCPECKHKWTEFMWINDRDNAKCPECGSKAETDYSAKDSSLLIKGKGFYEENTVR